LGALLIAVALVLPTQAQSGKSSDNVKRSRAVAVASGTTSDGATFAVSAQRETARGGRRTPPPRTCLSVRTHGPDKSSYYARVCNPFPSRTGSLDVAYVPRTGSDLVFGLVVGDETVVRAELADGRLIDAQTKSLPVKWGGAKAFVVVAPAEAQPVAVRAYDRAGKSTGGILFPGS
jgi:hypothetical protein